MRFVDILHDGRLWATVYDGDTQDILTKTFSDWLDPGALEVFFGSNIDDLESYFQITNLDVAIYDTIADAVSLSSLILDINPDTNLNRLFRPLESDQGREMLLPKANAKGNRSTTHRSWLRLYALKLGKDVYLITGGAIKLTEDMADRVHTLYELKRLEMVRQFLCDEGITELS